MAAIPWPGSPWRMQACCVGHVVVSTGLAPVGLDPGLVWDPDDVDECVECALMLADGWPTTLSRARGPLPCDGLSAVPNWLITITNRTATAASIASSQAARRRRSESASGSLSGPLSTTTVPPHRLLDDPQYDVRPRQPFARDGWNSAGAHRC